MATYYVRSGASGSNDGSDWTNAFTAISSAASASGAGDMIYVAHDHAETPGSLTTLTWGGTAASPCRVLCTDDDTEPPTTLQTTATVTCSDTLQIRGCAHIHGISFKSGTGSTTYLYLGDSYLTHQLTMEECGLYARNTSSNCGMYFGTTQSSSDQENLISLRGCDFHFGNSAGSIYPRFTNVRIDGGQVDGTDYCDSFITTMNGYTNDVLVDNMDLTAVTSYLALATGRGGGRIWLRGCSMASGATAGYSAAYSGYGGTSVWADGCGYGTPAVMLDRSGYAGRVLTSTSAYLDSSDGTDDFSWLLDSSGSCHWAAPLYSPEILAYNSTTGTSQTASVEILVDWWQDLNQAYVWLELDYLDESGTVHVARTIPERATALETIGTAGSLTAGTGTGNWTKGTASDSWYSYKLQADFTAQRPGVVRARVAVAFANLTAVYVDPKMTIA